jgi:hypothetical protein
VRNMYDCDVRLRQKVTVDLILNGVVISACADTVAQSNIIYPVTMASVSTMLSPSNPISMFDGRMSKDLA